MKRSYFSNSTGFRIKISIIVFLILLAISSFVYTQYLLIQIRNNERASTELWAKASAYISNEQYPQMQQTLEAIKGEIGTHPLIGQETRQRWQYVIGQAQSDLSNAGLDFVADEVIINNLFEIPSIVVNEDNEIVHHRNIDQDKLNPDLIDSYARMNEPISFSVGEGENAELQRLYYGNSAIVSSLTYFPYVQFGLLTLFLGLGYASLSSIKRNEQSKLWVGMARESAHQLGTPITSLMGWIALMKDLSQDDENMLSTIHELERDVERLQRIADRFNKIGSEPELKVVRVGPILRNVTAYMGRRMPQLGGKVQLYKDIEMEARVALNEQLFTWALENLIKNAIDAMGDKTEGYVKISSRTAPTGLQIDVEDSGKGIERRDFKDVFNPGYSTKKRGWGLGLSLARRIIEEYHGGKIFIYESTLGEGTTFRLELPTRQDYPNMLDDE